MVAKEIPSAALIADKDELIVETNLNVYAKKGTAERKLTNQEMDIITLVKDHKSSKSTLNVRLTAPRKTQSDKRLAKYYSFHDYETKEPATANATTVNRQKFSQNIL